MRSADSASIYDIEKFGDARILHLTDTHAQLRPVFFREPSVNIGIGSMLGKPPHLAGKAFLDMLGVFAEFDESEEDDSEETPKAATQRVRRCP